MMKLFQKRKHAANSQIEPLVLRSAIDTPLTVFPSEVIASHRRMITGLLYQQHIPAKIAILSTLQGEGVTYTALALAATMASDFPKRVCVIELNMWSPGLMSLLRSATHPPVRKRLLGKAAPVQAFDENLLPSSSGVAGVLSGAASLEEALIPTHLPNLMLLPAGELAVEARPTAARSEAVKTLIGQVAEQFDHVILDVPALLASSDAIALASHADAGYLVVRQGVTPIALIKQALDEIKHISMIGVVMNQAQFYTPRWLQSMIPQV